MLFFNQNNQCYAVVSNLEAFYCCLWYLCIYCHPFLHVVSERRVTFFLSINVFSPIANRGNLKRHKIPH